MRLLASDTNRPTGRFCFFGDAKGPQVALFCSCRVTSISKRVQPAAAYGEQSDHSGPIHSASTSSGNGPQWSDSLPGDGIEVAQSLPDFDDVSGNLPSCHRCWRTEPQCGQATQRTDFLT